MPTEYNADEVLEMAASIETKGAAFYRKAAKFHIGAQEMLNAGAPISLGSLSIRGDDLIEKLGIKPGPAIGKILEALLDRVIEDPSQNTVDNLLCAADTISRDGN